MRINTAFILCAGLGERLRPLTQTIPKPLLEIGKTTVLEKCINMIIEIGIKKIFINTYHLKEQILKFIHNKKFPIEIQIIEDGSKILDTGGGILKMINNSQDNDFLIFNPDTLWREDYINEIIQMQDLYFSNKLNNILLLANKKLSFDQNLKADFDLTNNTIRNNNKNDFIYIGCQILNRCLFENYEIHKFSVSKIWNELLKKNELNGFESLNKFYHLTNLETFKKLQDS